MLADSYQNPIREWQVTIKLHLVAGFKSESDTFQSVHGLPIILFTTPSMPLFHTVHLPQSQFWLSPQAAAAKSLQSAHDFSHVQLCAAP